MVVKFVFHDQWNALCYVLPLLSAVRKRSVFFFFSKNWRFLFNPSGVPVWAQMADDETLRAPCTSRKRKNQMSQRTMRKTMWAGSTLASACWSSKESATCPLIWEGKKKRWMVLGYVIVIWSLIIMIFFFYFITKKPLNISHHTTSQPRTPSQWSGFLMISSDLNSEGFAKLLLAVLRSLFQIGKMAVLITSYLFVNRKYGCPLELSALFSILKHKGETSGVIP